MAKILRIPGTPYDDVVTGLEALLEKAKAGEISAFTFAAKCPDGDVATAWACADPGTRQELIGHQQIDVMMAVVEVNLG